MKINNHRQNRRYFKAAAPVQHSETLAPITGKPAKPSKPGKPMKRETGRVIRG